MTSRRHDVATGAVGYSLVGTGGVARELGIRRAHAALGRDRNTEPFRPPGLAVARAIKKPHSAKATALYLGGTTLAAAGAPAAAVGTYNLTRRRVRKADHRRTPFLQEGVAGTREAINERATNFKNAPAKSRGVPYAVGTVGGLAGSAATHRALDLVGRARKAPVHGLARAALTAAGGIAGATAGVPVGSRMVARRSPGYELTPVGVRRKRTMARRPSTQANVVEGRANQPNSSTGYALRSQLVPTSSVHKAFAENYYGRNMSQRRKRATVLAAGGTPFVGDYAAAAQAARIAPPEQRHSAAALQFGGAKLGGLAGGVAGAYGTAALARHSPAFRQKAEDAQAKIKTTRQSIIDRVPGSQHLPAGPGVGAKLRRTAMTRVHPRISSAVLRAAKPLAGVGAAAALGGYAGKTAGGFAGGYAGYGQALNRERTRNAKLSRRPVKKLAGPVMTPREQHQLARKKRIAAVAGTTTGLTGLAAGALEGAKRVKRWAPHHGRLGSIQTGLLATGAGVGGANSLNFAGVLRREARQDDRLHKSMPAGLHVPAPLGVRKPVSRRSFYAVRRYSNGATNPYRVRATVG